MYKHIIIYLLQFQQVAVIKDSTPLAYRLIAPAQSTRKRLILYNVDSLMRRFTFMRPMQPWHYNEVVLYYGEPSFSNVFNCYNVNRFIIIVNVFKTKASKTSKDSTRHSFLHDRNIKYLYNFQISCTLYLQNAFLCATNLRKYILQIYRMITFPALSLSHTFTILAPVELRFIPI